MDTHFHNKCFILNSSFLGQHTLTLRANVYSVSINWNIFPFQMEITTKMDSFHLYYKHISINHSICIPS
jgi:hypothetical protein